MQTGAESYWNEGIEMKAIVNVPVCILYEKPTRQSTVVDEALFGMVVEILDEVIPGWLRIRTHYRYEGIVSDEDLLMDEEAAEDWENLPRKIILNKNFCDVLSEPRVQGWTLETLPRGGLVSPLGEPENGWQEVQLPDGRTGYVMAGILGEYHQVPVSNDEETLRKAVVEAALRYRGTHYRWGGKSPRGIDCSGLCSMAYLLCGIIIFRDASIREGFPMKEIPIEQMKPGDLLFFPGHVAMYLGEGRYCHSSSRMGCDGVSINSLNPGDPDYREDLHHSITRIGSYF